jgi:hypothetical protein
MPIVVAEAVLKIKSHVYLNEIYSILFKGVGDGS